MKFNFIVISGVSGVGKTTIINMLRQIDNRIEYISPITTRKLREGESNKVHVSKKEFLILEKNNDFVFVNKIFTNLYGTPKKDIINVINNNKIAILDFPINKTKELDRYDYIKIFSIYIIPDDIDKIIERLVKEDRDNIDKRKRAIFKEIYNFKNGKYNDIINLEIINTENNIENSVNKIYSYITKYFR
ncbi:MAG: hypothetical protein ACYDBX_02630 [Patescibacteria group bacterium]